jgi:PAS domain S-box-containing protein
MKLYQKLLLGFACVALLVSSVGFVAQQMNQRVAWSVHQLSDVAVVEVSSSAEMIGALRENLSAVRHVARAATRADREVAVGVLDESLLRFETGLTLARSATSASRSRAAASGREDLLSQQDARMQWLESAAAGFNEYRLALDAFVASGARGAAAMAALETELEPLAQETILPPLARYREAAGSGLAAEAAFVRAQLTQANRFLFVAVLLGIGLTLVLGILISNSIAGPLGVLAAATRSIGRGRLDHRVLLKSYDEVGQLGAALNRMAEQLGRTTVTKSFLNNVLASMSDPLLVLDEAGNVDLANEAVFEMLGWRPEQLAGEPLARLLAEGEADAQRILDDIADLGYTGHLEVGLRTREGAEIPVVFTGAVMRSGDGHVEGIVCVAKDITQQKMVESELVSARERAEEMARMKSSFLANMSHEIRTPLTGIIGSAQVLAEQSTGDGNEMAGIIERAGMRLLSTINAILDMARIEAGELHPTLEPVNLAEEAADVVMVLRRLAEAKSLTLSVDERSRGVWALADPAFVNSIITNLVGNAIKFTAEGGITVEIEGDGEGATLTVRDTGIGINEDFLPHLFDEFRQESNGLHRSHEGSGLGLAITRRLTELLGGEISVASAKGEGSAFTVRLPLAATRTTPPVASRVLEPAG